jgi:hypothetical protein
MYLPPRTREHVITALGATPVVLLRLAERFVPTDPVWEYQAPGRFTPREHVAHMADWEDIFFERMRLTVEVEEPLAPNPDETALSIEHKYSSSIPLEMVQLFAERRQKLIEFLKAREASEWHRTCIHPKNGSMTLEAQAVHVLGHDGYHFDYLARTLVVRSPEQSRVQ